MDTSRIGQFLGWASKANTAADAPSAQSGGFADLLFGVMSRRQQTQLSPAKVSTVLPIGEAGPSTHRNNDRPGQTVRPVGETAAGSSEPQIATAKSTGTANPIAGSSAKPAAPEDGKAGIEEATELAPVGETIEPDPESGDEIDLQSDANGTAGGEADGESAGQPGDQPTDQQAMAAAIEPQIVAAAATTTPTETGAEAAPAAAAAPTNGATEAAQPDAAATDIALAATATVAAALTGEKKAQAAAIPLTQGETETPAETATKVVNQATDAALSLVGETLTTETDAAAGVAMRQSDRRGEDQAGQFRRAAQPSRQRTDTTGAGTAGTTAQPAAAALTRAVPSTGLPTTPAVTTGFSTTLQPVSLEGSFGVMPGMPGWNNPLIQGAAGRRPDFLANLRQNLQNLPAHDQVALGIQRAARDGGGSITLQLSPTELGRIHMKLDIDEEKNVRASVSVERPATLDLLQKDVKALERALQDAGLKMDQSDLSFSLHRGGEESFAREFGGGGQEAGAFEADQTDNDMPAELNQAAIIATGDGLVDVQI